MAIAREMNIGDGSMGNDTEYLDANQDAHVLKMFADAGYADHASTSIQEGGWFPVWLVHLRERCTGHVVNGPDTLWLKFAQPNVRMGYVTMMLRRAKRHSKALSAAHRLGGRDGLWAAYVEACGA